MTSYLQFIFIIIIAFAFSATTATANPNTSSQQISVGLDINFSLKDVEGTEAISGDIILAGVPNGATLNFGKAGDNNTWIITQEDLSVAATNDDGDPVTWEVPGLTISLPKNSRDNFNLRLRITTITGEGTITTTEGIVKVNADISADAPVVTVKKTSGVEDHPISLDIRAALTDTDGSESLSAVTITGIPSGATLSAGTMDEDGSWVVELDDLAGLILAPVTNSDVDLKLSVSATSTDGTDRATSTSIVDIPVSAVADAPTLSVTDAAGFKNRPIALNISAALTDTDGSESLSAVTITGIPSGANLSAGTENNDGSWTTEAENLKGLTITTPKDLDGDFKLSVSVTSTDAIDTATATGVINISLTALAFEADSETNTVASTIIKVFGIIVLLMVSCWITIKINSRNSDGS